MRLVNLNVRGFLWRWPFVASIGMFVGCQWFADDADHEVYRLIETRQQAALGKARDMRIGEERWPAWKANRQDGEDAAYRFVPHPVDANATDAFPTASTHPAGTQPADTQPSGTQPAETQPAGTEPAETQPSGTQPATTPSEESSTAEMNLPGALRYAFKYSRELQTAKEDLYLSALALSLERHLWTPQLTGEISSHYANYGQIRDFDHAMDAISQVAVEQKLPYGGQVTAKVISTLMRDLTHHITSGETGQAILEANIPLLRGAGRAAYESRYQAERDLIYAVRTFERFRRTVAVDIARDYLDLQQSRQEIVNNAESIKSFAVEAERAQALWRAGRVLQLEVQRAEQDRLVAINRKVDAVEAYQTALDVFKIRIGMPTETPLDVEMLGDPSTELTPGREGLGEAQAAAIQMPDVAEPEAVRVGLKHRLDLLNSLDRIDDARRGVDVAENNLLPDLSATGSVQMVTDPADLGMLEYDRNRATWRGGLALELPLDRKRERNALRGALIGTRRAERAYEQTRDLVELQVRRAMRRVAQQQESLRIQILNRNVALERRRGARIRFDQGLVGNREVIDAENALLAARNRLAQAQAQVRLAILEFWRDTDTLRIDEEGQWPQSNSQGG